MMKTTLFLAASTALATFAIGCAPPADSHDDSETRRSRAKMTEAEGKAMAAPNALYLKEDGKGVKFSESGRTLTVCEKLVDSDTRSRIHQYDSDARPVIVDQRDGKVVVKSAQQAVFAPADPMCPGDSPSAVFRLFDAPHVDFLSMELARDYVLGFQTSKFSCEGGVQLSNDTKFNIDGLKLENGKLTPPSFNLEIDGKADTTGKVKCSLNFSRPMWVMAGPVPVYFTLDMSIGLEVGVKSPGGIRAALGTSGGFIDGDVTIAGGVEFGITLYEFVGGYVGADLELEIGQPKNENCTRPVDLNVKLKAGAKAGLEGIVGVATEISGTALGPFSLRTSTCSEPPPPEQPAPVTEPEAPAAPSCSCDGEDLSGPVHRDVCGANVCAGDYDFWQCTPEGFQRTDVPCEGL